MQAARADVGRGAPDRLGGADREEIHLRVADGGDLLGVAAVEGLEEALDQLAVLGRRRRGRGRGRAIARIASVVVEACRR